MYIFLGAVLAILAAGATTVGLRHRRNMPIRLEAEGQEVTFRLKLDHVKKVGRSGSADIRGPMALIVRADTFEVCGTTSPLQTLFGLDYWFRARDTTIELGEFPSISYFLTKSWIIVRPRHGNRTAGFALNSENYMYDARVALVRAGATPIGPAPPISPGKFRISLCDRPWASTIPPRPAPYPATAQPGKFLLDRPS